ncbi:PREDICTED: zinc finger protein 431-like [Ceratosolen solmsi marchali]|uniref:Zinc finger protein 431-like n=1 Tax=Ceratosolen solmsi marchali TaxID=326594 RepID=A0AAJ7DU86_9HYME|nr:PREDICTED: zinc finger protein 431-like [Ceratosolen solmsi marchali]
MSDFQQLGNLSTGSSAESGSSPASTVVDLDNEHSRYCNPDVYKVYREGLDGSAFSVVQSDGFNGFFEFDTLSTHPRITIASSIAEEMAMTPVIGSAPRRRRKREQKVLSSWEREKRICCSQCSKKFRTTAHLKTHFVVHTMGEGTKLSRCAVCDKGFCHRGALTLHMRAHASKESSRLRGEGC